MKRRKGAELFLAVFTALIAGCSLSSGVTVEPLRLRPGDIERAPTIESAVARGDFRHAVELERRQPAAPFSRDYALVGRADLASGRLSEATARLRRALDESDQAPDRREILWDLSQAAFLANDFGESLRWAREAREAGLGVLQWHIDLLGSLVGEPVYQSVGEDSTRVRMSSNDPDIPRVDVELADGKRWEAIIDSGAVISIVSERLAATSRVKRLGEFEGTFYGLVGEPIPVRFGLLESLRIGDIVIRSVPVAIMPDQKLNFMLKGAKFDMDLLLGAGFLKEFRMIFDYQAGALDLEFLSTEERSPAEDQNLFFIDFRPFAHATVNRKGWYTFLLDTGSEVTFLNAAKLRFTGVGGIPRVHSATLQGLGGAHRRGGRVSEIEIGIDTWNALFEHIPLYNDDSKSSGIVGQNLLRAFRVTIDFGRMRLELERPTRRGFGRSQRAPE